jgi:enoyl-CoA hydratase/carnithine racemase
MPDVLVEKVGTVAVITLQRTTQRNALSMSLCRELTTVIGTTAPDVRALVIATAGSDFCVGADLVERHALLPVGLDEARAASTALTTAVLSSPVPVVTAATGYTLGGGLELALGTDLIVADHSAVLGLPESGIGIVPGGGGTQLLARRIGWGRAVDLALTGRFLDAAEAHAIGLVDRLEPDSRAAAITLAEELATRSATSVRLIRTAMRDGWGVPLVQGLEVEDAAWREAAASGDYRASLEAFAAKHARRGNG